jgi:tetratricopeptide (TPR) repeat protein
MRSSSSIVILAALSVIMSAGGCSPTATTGKQAVRAKWEKTSSQAKLPVAQQQYAQGKYADALKTVGQCLVADPNFAQARLLNGKILMAVGQRQKAVDEIQKAVDINGKLDEGYFLLALQAEDQKDYSRATRLYAQACELDAVNVSYILGEVRVLCATDEYDKALRLLTVKMEVMSACVELKFTAAEIYQRQNKLDEAISLYRQARLLSQDDMEIAESLAYCYMLASKWSEAADVFEQVVDKAEQKQKKELNELLAMCYMNSGKYGKAFNSYNGLTVTDRNNSQAWLKMGQAALGAGQAQRSLACGQKAIEIQSDYADAIVLVGCSQYELGRYSDAIDNFAKTISDDKLKAFSWIMIGKCCQRKGDVEKARQAFEQARIFAESDLLEYLVKLDTKL